MVDADGQPQFRITAQAALASFSVSYWRAEGAGPPVVLGEPTNIMRGFVQVMLDTIGLFAGATVDADAVCLEGPDGAATFLDSSFDGLKMEYQIEQFQRTALAAHAVRGLRLGLADFRLAIASPEDTLFLCYRGLEGIRADFAEAEVMTNEGASWERMREVTELTRGEIDAIKSIADARRHGGLLVAGEAERADALRLLRRALLRYAEWWHGQQPPAPRPVVEHERSE